MKANEKSEPDKQGASDDFWAGAPMIHSISREQALAEGLLVDVTEADAAKGKFRVPVAVTRALWDVIETIPETGRGAGQDWQGRLHDVTWMAHLAARGAKDSDRAEFKLILDRVGTAKRMATLVVHIGPGDTPAPVVTIGFPEDF